MLRVPLVVTEAVDCLGGQGVGAHHALDPEEDRLPLPAWPDSEVAQFNAQVLRPAEPLNQPLPILPQTAAYLFHGRCSMRNPRRVISHRLHWVIAGLY